MYSNIFLIIQFYFFRKGGFLIDGALLSIQSAQPKTSTQSPMTGSTSPGFVRGSTSSSHYHDVCYF